MGTCAKRGGGRRRAPSWWKAKMHGVVHVVSEVEARQCLFPEVGGQEDKGGVGPGEGGQGVMGVAVAKAAGECRGRIEPDPEEKARLSKESLSRGGHAARPERRAHTRRGWKEYSGGRREPTLPVRR